MNVHLERINRRELHEFLELVNEDILASELWYAEQILYICPIYPIIEQLVTLIYILVYELIKVKHVVFGMVVGLDEMYAPFFKFVYLVLIIPFELIKVL